MWVLGLDRDIPGGPAAAGSDMDVCSRREMAPAPRAKLEMSVSVLGLDRDTPGRAGRRRE